LRRDWRQILYRDVQITGYLVLREQTSLRALGDVVHNLPKLWARRNDIMRRRIATDEEMLAWFGGPVERPLEEKAASPSPPPAGETD
jgi:hypothetical protein